MVILKEEKGVRLCAKLECNNPMGTGKMRGALAFFERAKEQGLLKPGREIVLSSGGGFALAVAALATAYKIPIRAYLLENAMSLVKDELLRLGVEIVDTATTRAERNQEATEYTKKTGAIFFDQHEGLPGFEANYKGTGPEIIKQTDRQVTDIVGCMGTGNFLYGVGKFTRDYALSCNMIIPRITAVESDSSLYGYFLKLQRLPQEERLKYLQKLEQKGVLEIVFNKRKQIDEIVPVLKEEGDIPGTGVSG
ncbi:MAG: pyridoxal-phosphate dependent enzyme, partial [Patescibacteria group bacterium]